MANRENVFTQLARAINRFSEHKLSKVELYDECVGLIEMADKAERTDRLQIEKLLGKHKEIAREKNVPYLNWKNGLSMLEG